MKAPIKKDLESVVKFVFEAHPTKNFNYKQIIKHALLQQASLKEIEAKDLKEMIFEAIGSLIVDEKIIEVDRGKYKLIPERSHRIGKIDITQSGAAFVINEDGDDDIYISPRNVRNALHGDTVKVFLFIHRNNKRRLEGEVVEIIKRSKEFFTGIIRHSQDESIFIPDSHKIHVDMIVQKNGLNGAKDGDKVSVRITQWIPNTRTPYAEVVKVLGKPGEHQTEMNSILLEYGFPLQFPEEVEREAKNISDTISNEEIKKRRDLRKVLTFTIDPEDAKDFDDALSIQTLGEDEFEIGVHIADVSHFIKEGSELDKEAFSRATSVYLVDRVIPMLPEKLSNEVCSLRPNEDKLCYSVIFKINNEAVVNDVWFGKTVIHSNTRFTYEQAQSIIEQKTGEHSKDILLMDSLAKKMRSKRISNGAINFEKSEVKFKLDEKMNPIGVYIKESKDAHKLIEEFMLLANRYVAEFVGKHHAEYAFFNASKKKNAASKTFIYRVHDVPDQEKLKNFAAFAQRFGHRLDIKSEHNVAQSINQLVKNISGKKEQNVLEQLAIRSMSKAVYTTENIGHYGLAFNYYSHFTSPIRRYPDLIAHRLLSLYLSNGKSIESKPLDKKCKHCSEMESQAAEAERASVKFKQVQYLENRIGEKFKGIISGVTEWGMYVELIENKCEGMIRLRDIPGDFFELDEKTYTIRGLRTGRNFTLGDEISVEIKKVNLLKKQIDFSIEDQGEIVRSKPKQSQRKVDHFKRKEKKKKRR